MLTLVACLSDVLLWVSILDIIIGGGKNETNIDK
jgi:hypothetical protein